MGIDQWVDRDALYENTLNLKKMVGVKVLSKRGIHLGRVVEVRTHPQNLNCEGILIKTGFFGAKRYFSTKYIERFSLQGVVLSVEPAYLLFNRKVITSDGKVVGKIVAIERVDKSNQIKSVTFKRLFHKPRIVSSDGIKTLGISVMLKETYEEEKKAGKN